MRTFRADEGYKLLLNDSIISTEICTPDDFDESRLRQITLEEAERIRQEQEFELEGGQDVNSN